MPRPETQLGPGPRGLVIVKKLGGGGQGDVVKAQDPKSGAFVVLKHMRLAPGDAGHDEALARFQREGACRFNHPNVQDPIDCFQEGDDWYIVFPFVDGCSLADYVAAQGGRLPVDQVIAIADQLAQALQAIYLCAFVHRDLKPENILIDKDGRVLVIDFGISKHRGHVTVTQHQGRIGSLNWMSPEQVQPGADIDHRSDLYAMGAILYWLATGRPVADGSTEKEVEDKVVNCVPPSPATIDPTIPANLDQACVRLLVKDRDLRFQTAQDFRLALLGPIAAAGNPVCLACHQPGEPQSRFCFQCGAALIMPAQVVARCFACGGETGEAAACTHCRRPFSHSDHRLTFVSGSTTGLVFRAPEGIYEVGREQVSSRDFYISKRHCRASCLNGTFALQDAGSANKTYVDGQSADQPIQLRPGCRVVIAGNTAIYSSH